MKPDNILLKRVMDQYPMRTKIVDFGFAKSLDEDMYTETVAGTGAYMAPEIKSQSERGVGYTVLVDMWSVGAVLYHILCGALPFPDPFTPVDRQPLNFPDDPWAEISDDAKDLIRKMLCPADERLTAAACLEHPWMKQDPKLPVFFPVGVRNVDPNL
ncbi:hypothetical protein SARC_07592 [Sphaeroforma arctica JP610]|uniref:Protein kinase domain-containing protein n=1 Tax=Sphaeroforma arctica JP610 TaxID=667725 RepID=A0A0L0FTZ3_9EUKA|nr:hypothetical protein SARC_07592 [Sphaeroforma arctica JP610]KNC80046.1 hypothetical protein SARC_07592 [Sphaeroforma arctica JP610]|eukprot:XP_014153948.1 hypothetical protein SARC_07592 [Sphaeroforma arctica JP610]